MEEPLEEWRPVENTGACEYEVSNLGRVRISPTTANRRQQWRAGRLISTTVGNSGYDLLWLRRAGKSETNLLHRVVATAFCGPPNGQVNHKDGDKRNNRADNLEWVTASQNNIHAMQTGLRANKISLADRDEARRLYFEEGLTQREIGQRFGVTDVLISKLLTGDAFAFDNGPTKQKGRHIQPHRKTRK